MNLKKLQQLEDDVVMTRGLLREVGIKRDRLKDQQGQLLTKMREACQGMGLDQIREADPTFNRDIRYAQSLLPRYDELETEIQESQARNDEISEHLGRVIAPFSSCKRYLAAREPGVVMGGAA